ncbi:relaxasome subunit MobC [Enterococcus hirae]|uniref:relaxasome subunit MobC n=2 Tax=Enterococcus TaxID=1350 RepID=UPI002DBE35F0|nr:relaxasome subunit MobC [Enterococcus hirae]MEB7441139.1 relaxasome subunit MobC [Enterococcus hirae]
MSTKRSYDERRKEVQEKIEKLKELDKRLAAQEKQAAKRKARTEFDKKFGGNDKRRARTHRLCRIGGAVESVLGREINGDEDIEKLIRFLKLQNERGNYFTDAMNR